MSVEEKGLSPPIRKNRGYGTKKDFLERRRKMAVVQGKLDNIRECMKVCQSLGWSKAWMETLPAYCDALGELETLMTRDGKYF